jgi:hypothetical protein
MTGYASYNYPAFNAAARRLRRAGFAVHNPAESDLEPGADLAWGDWMRRALALLLTADGVALLPASGNSRGARLECHVAHELGMPIRTVPRWLTQAGQDAYMQKLIADRP